MSTIRFVKPPNDNRVRQFPSVQMTSDVIHITTPNPRDVLHITTPVPKDEVLHITTPKRKKAHIPPWHLFTTTTNDNDKIIPSSSSPPCDNNIDFNKNSISDMNNDNGRHSRRDPNGVKRQSSQKRLSDSPVGSYEHSNKMQRDFNQNTLSSSDDEEVAIFKKLDKTASPSKSVSQLNEGRSSPNDQTFQTKTVGRASAGDVNQIQGDIPVSGSDSPQREPSLTKCPVMNFYNNFGGETEDSLCDVSEEEVENLPDVSQPGGVLNTSPGRQHAQQQQQQEQQQQQQYEHQIQTQQQQQDIQNQQPPTTVGSYKYLESPRYLCRSISGTENDGKAESFFSSINSKSYDMEKREPLNADDLREMSSLLRMNTLRNIHFPTKHAWESESGTGKTLGGSDSSLDHSHEKNIRASKTPIQKMPRSLSRDSFSADRLRMRRCALADPEKMIMSQALRERIEKDVEKRKHSMVRKVSQFFNVHMGLNKEEDLI